jgi:Zn-dependent peptidase ImmA (M78 family)
VIELINSYGLYKNARDGAWQALIDNKIASLPVNVVQVTIDNDIILLKNSEQKKLNADESGVSVFDGKQWFIIYDDKLPHGRKRFTVAHELGHIFLGHPLIAGFHKRTVGKPLPPTEREANLFASRFLSPACVLWGLNIKTAADIARVCGLSGEAAGYRAERMAELYKRGKFLTSPLEARVYEQFKAFIEEQKNKPPE